MGVQSFWGCGTFSSSRTSGVRGHTVHYQPFTGWWKRFLNNVDFYFRFAVMGFWNFWKVTNLGQNTQNPFHKIILIFVSRNSVGSTQRQREKIAIPQFEQFVFENSKNTFGRYFSNAGFLWTRIILVLPASNIFTKFRRGHPLRGAKYRWGLKKLWFSTNKSLYLANDTKYRHSYYGRRIGTHMRSNKWCYFQWAWTNPNPVLKATPLFVAKYLTNGYRYGHSYYRKRIGNRTQAFEWHQLQWPWVTSNPDFKVTILFKVK